MPGRRVLLLDGSLHPSDPLVGTLKAAGWAVTAATTLAEARQCLQASPPQVILTVPALADATTPELLAGLAGSNPVVFWTETIEPALAHAIAADWLPRTPHTEGCLPLLLDQIVRRWSEAQGHRAEATRLGDELRRLGDIIEGTPIAAWEWNVQTGETVFSESWAAMLGYRLTELEPVSIETWNRLIHADDLQRSEQLLRQHFTGALSHYECECRLRHKDGTWRWVLARGRLASRTGAGQPLMMFGTHLDITPRKMAEQALGESENRLHRAEQIARVGHLEYHLATGLVSFSENSQSLCGLPKREEHLEDVLQLLAPRDRARLRPALLLAIERRQAIDLLLPFRRPADQRELTVHLVADYDPGRNTVFGVIHDVTERQQLLTELHEKSFYLERAQETARIGTYRFTLATNHWSATGKLVEIFGIADDHPRDLAGWLSLIPPSHREEMAAYLAQDVIGRVQRFDRDYPIVRPSDGQTRWLHGTGEIELDGAGRPKALIGTIQDITELRQAAESLQQSEQRFRAILHSVQFVAVQGYAPDGTTQYWNEASERLYGYTAEEAIGRNLVDLIIPAEMQEQVRWAIQQMAATGQPIPAGELLLRRKDNSRVAVFSSHAIVQLPDQPPELFCVDVDLTALRRAEDRIQLQAKALNAAANAIVITDRTGRIEWANTAFTTLSGYTLEESVGQDPSDLIGSGRQDAAFFRAMWDTILSGQVWQGELVNKSRAGRYWTEEMTITPIRGADGGISHFIAVKQDVTQRKVFEQQIRQAQKMDAIGQLAGGVAHDFNNILAAVLMYLGLIQDEPSLDPAVRNSLKDLTREIHRGASLTRQLLAFSRQQAMQPRLIDLAEVVTSLLKMLRRLLGENISITVRGGTGLPGVDADVGMIEQVILNLCINARDAMPRGGALSLQLDTVELTPESAGANGPGRPGNFVRLRVIDDGEGMAPEILARIFEPFFTTKGPTQGTGLGLAIVYGIVQQHRGWITAESSPGAGTIFNVYLPASASPPLPSAQPETAPIPTGRGETILLVEDELSLRATVAVALRHFGYRVIEAADGPGALAAAGDPAIRIDLLLTDLVLPNGLTGLDVVRRLRKDRPNLRVITSTGYSREESVLEDGRPIAMLRKPYDQTQLLRQIRSSLDQRAKSP